ncbi:MAG: polymer-forming cytoskeletal protein [Campylobacteraceae bacterium]|jgi:cytoskeletal protein CcmA (bactofilin family)|nr:polymer-forming cytoskeletal protein [Campylobacteraceae bacterium]
MGLINKRNDDNAKQNTEATIITSGVTIDGVFDFIAKVHVYGQLSGKMKSSNAIVIGRGGVIKGNIEAKTLIVNGSFEGNAECDSIYILEGGVLIGNISSEELMIEKNAHFEGESRRKNNNARIEYKQQEEEIEEDN